MTLHRLLAATRYFVKTPLGTSLLGGLLGSIITLAALLITVNYSDKTLLLTRESNKLLSESNDQNRIALDLQRQASEITIATARLTTLSQVRPYIAVLPKKQISSSWGEIEIKNNGVTPAYRVMASIFDTRVSSPKCTLLTTQWIDSGAFNMISPGSELQYPFYFEDYGLPSKSYWHLIVSYESRLKYEPALKNDSIVTYCVLMTLTPADDGLSVLGAEEFIFSDRPHFLRLLFCHPKYQCEALR